MTNEQFKKFLNGLVIEDLQSHLIALLDHQGKVNLLMESEENYVDYVFNGIGVVDNDFDDPLYKQNIEVYLNSSHEDELDIHIRKSISRNRLIVYLVNNTSTQDRKEIEQRQLEIIRLTPKMVEQTIEEKNRNELKDHIVSFNDRLHKIQPQHIRIRKVGEFQQETDRMVMKDPDFCTYIKTEDVLDVKPGKWSVYLIETNLRKVEVTTIGCILQHEDDTTELFPSILKFKWEAVMVQRPVKSSIFSVVDEQYFNLELTAEQKELLQCPFEQITQWYDWGRQLLADKKYAKIKGGCFISQFELRDRYNLMILKDAKENSTLIGVEFNYQPRIFEPIFNYYVDEGECSFPF